MPQKTVTMALLTDIHYDPDSSGSSDSGRCCNLADTLLIQAVSRLNSLIRPRVTLIPGDVLNDGTGDRSEENLRRIKSILDRLDSPYLIIPGNHDGDPDLFYRVFDRPGEYEDRGEIRFLAFTDRDEPGYNASRSGEDLSRFVRARRGYDGPLVSLQHVCLFPPGQEAAPYNYTNAGEIIKAMKSAGVTLSVSGHYHRGAPLIHDKGMIFVNAPALCESPFPFLTLSMDVSRGAGSEEGRITARRHELVPD